jgi:hypothetical protein
LGCSYLNSALPHPAAGNLHLFENTFGIKKGEKSVSNFD